MSDNREHLPALPGHPGGGFAWNAHQQGVPAAQAGARHARAPKIGTTGAESVWYALMNIPFGAAYFAKIPVKKALADFGLVPGLTGAEQFWYVLMNFAFGAGYFCKVIAAKAISELPQFIQARQAATIQAHTIRAHTRAPLR
jgi:hypothetical protein